jgi:hypothetical protein
MMNRKALNRRKVLDIRIGRLVQAQMAVAALQNGETLLLGGHCLAGATEGGRHAGRDRPRHVGSRSDHASFMRNEPRLAIDDTPLLGWVRS